MTRFELFRRSLWLTVKRSRVSAVSRRQLRIIGFWIIYLIGYGLLVRNEAREVGPWGFAFSAVLLALAAGVGVFIRRHNAHFGDSLLKLSVREAPSNDDLRHHAKTIAALLLRTAVLVDRAGSEVLYQQHRAAPDHAGVCRRRTLDLARKPETWEQYQIEEQELLLSQEGSWSWDQVWPRLLQAEDVRVMRWVLKVDEVLTPFEFLQPDLTPAIEITVKPETVLDAECLASFDLRPAQTMAQVMVTRCLGEGIRRGFMAENDIKMRSEYLRFAERMAEDESQDLLVGLETVATADQARIQWIAQAALRRYRVLSALIDYLNGAAESELIIT